MPPHTYLQRRRNTRIRTPSEYIASPPFSTYRGAKTVPNLTDLSIKRLPIPETGTVTHWDTSVKGFGVRVSPKGARTFIALIGSGKRHKIGRYPLISLSDARNEARKQLAKKTLGTYEKPNTLIFAQALEKYLKACEAKNRPRTVHEYKRHLAYFPFKDRRLTTIRKLDVATRLDTITAKGERAHALVSVKVFFSWCASQGYIDASPITALKTPAQKAQKARHALSPQELAEVLRKALTHPYPFGSIIALLVLTGQRRNEIASLEWERLTPETITIPADIAKNHIEHTLPYGPMARNVLEAIHNQSQYVFPASREHVRGKPTTTFNGWGKAKAEFDATLENVAPYKLHDLRRSYVTMLQSLGIPLEVREKLLNHVSGTQAGVAGVYNVYGYDDEMKEAVAKYEAFMVGLLA